MNSDHKFSPLITSSNEDGTYTVFRDMTFYHGWIGSNDYITIPKGFRYDMASIPRPLWWLIPRDDMHLRRAAVVHDYGYRYQLGKRHCDHLMSEISKADGAPFWKRLIVSAGLKTGGWVAYKKLGRYHRSRIQGFMAQSFNEGCEHNPYVSATIERRWWNWGWIYKRDHPEEDKIKGLIPMQPNGTLLMK